GPLAQAGDLGLRLASHLVLIGAGLAQRVRFRLGSHTLGFVTCFRDEFGRLPVGGAADLLRPIDGGLAGPRCLLLCVVQECQHCGELGRRVSAAIHRDAGTAGGTRCASGTEAVPNILPLRHRTPPYRHLGTKSVAREIFWTSDTELASRRAPP